MESLLESTEALSSSVDVFCSTLIQNIHIYDGQQSRNELLSLEAKFSTLVLKLRSTVNVLSPANKLPPETLSQVFSYLSTPNSVAVASGFDIPRPFREWAAVTHVCRHWREAAIASPSLWSKIHAPRPDLMELFLNRSGACPLEVDAILLPGSHEDPPLFGPLLPHLNRLKTLSFQISQRTADMGCLLTEVTVPSLERLCISAAHVSSQDDYPVNWIPSLFTRNTQAPRLQHLCLSYISFVSPFKFDNLSHLCFDHVPFLEIRLPVVLEVLACNPNLRELLLSQGEATDDHDLQPLSKPHIPLHSLQKFRVTDMSPSATAYLLSALELEEKGLALHFKDVSYFDGTFATIFPPTFPYGLSIFDAPKVELDSTGGQYSVVQTTGPASSVRIETRISYYPRRSHAARVLEDHHPSTHVVKELWIHARYPGRRTSLRFIPHLRGFPNVEVLVIKASRSAIVDQLCFVIGPEGKYPQLSTLVVYIPCWTFADFYKFVEVLRHYHPKLRKVRVGAVVWVDLEAVVRALGNITKDNNTLAFEVHGLDLGTDFGGMELPEVCTVGDVTWREWKCGLRTPELEEVERTMRDIFSEETDLNQWSQAH